jgi:hypothetical protein
MRSRGLAGDAFAGAEESAPLYLVALVHWKNGLRPQWASRFSDTTPWIAANVSGQCPRNKPGFCEGAWSGCAGGGVRCPRVR